MGRKRVLVIDDDRDALAIYGSILTLAGYLVMYEDAPMRACEAAGRFRPDAILLDFGLAGTTDQETAATLHADARCAGISIIILTADVALQKVSFPPNVHRVLLKPCEPRAVLDALSMLLDESAPSE
ncbi:MAG TPA: response regulator [Longimicrobium sp.]